MQGRESMIPWSEQVGERESLISQGPASIDDDYNASDRHIMFESDMDADASTSSLGNAYKLSPRIGRKAVFPRAYLATDSSRSMSSGEFEDMQRAIELSLADTRPPRERSDEDSRLSLAISHSGASRQRARASSANECGADSKPDT